MVNRKEKLAHPTHLKKEEAGTSKPPLNINRGDQMYWGHDILQTLDLRKFGGRHAAPFTARNVTFPCTGEIGKESIYLLFLQKKTEKKQWKLTLFLLFLCMEMWYFAQWRWELSALLVRDLTYNRDLFYIWRKDKSIYRSLCRRDRWFTLVYKKKVY